jgi:hypothetical protein
MRKYLVAVLLLTFLMACEKKPSSPEVNPEGLPAPKVIVERERVEREEPLPPEVKIKLRRDGKDNYSWELSGSDVDQVLKVNEKLRKRLGGEQQK